MNKTEFKPGFFSLPEAFRNFHIIRLHVKKPGDNRPVRSMAGSGGRKRT